MKPHEAPPRPPRLLPRPPRPGSLPGVQAPHGPPSGHLGKVRSMTRKMKWLDCWVPHRLQMLRSPPWRLAPIPLRRALERLEIEHLSHGGFKSGALYVSYGQFEASGISRRSILAVLELGGALGLVETIRPTDPLGDIRAPNAYRLTYVPAMNKGAPTDEWKSVNEDRAQAAVERFREKERAYQSRKSSKRMAA